MKDNRDNKDNIQALITVADKALVRKAAQNVAAKYCVPEQRHSEQEELYHYGIIGLLQAKKRFDRSKNIPFAAFAVQRIRGEMISYLRVRPLVHQPQLVRTKVKELQQARYDLEVFDGSATTKDIAAKLGWDQKKVQKVSTIKTDIISITQQDRQNDDTVEGDREFASRIAGPEKIALRNELGKLFAKCLEKVGDSRARLILVARLLHEKTLQDLADDFDCTAESIRQRQKKATDSLRNCFEKNGWDKYSMVDLEPVMGKDEIIMKAIRVWQNKIGKSLGEIAGEDHLGPEILYRLADTSGLKNANEQELEHLSLCPACLTAWVEWQESIKTINMPDLATDAFMTYGLLKAAATVEWIEPLQLESACGQFLLTVFPELSSPDRGMITLEVKDLQQDTVVEGRHLIVRDGNGANILSGMLCEGRLAGRYENIKRLKLDSWTLVVDCKE